MAGEEAANRHLPAVERQYRRGMDPLDPGAVPFSVHRAAQPRRARRTPARPVRHHRDRRNGHAPDSGRHAGRNGTGTVCRRDRRGGRAGVARFRHRGWNAGHPGQRRVLRHRTVQSAGGQRAGRLAAGPVLLLRLATARGDFRSQASPGGRTAAHAGGDVRAQSGLRHAPRFSRQSAGQLREGPQSAGERLPAGGRCDPGQGRGARRQLRQRPHRHSGLPAAVARAVARHVQVPLQCSVLQPVDGAGGDWRWGSRGRTRRRRESAAVGLAQGGRVGEDRDHASGGAESHLLYGARTGRRGTGQAARSRAGHLPARSHSAAGRFARAGGRRCHGTGGSRVVGATQAAGGRPAHQGFQRD